MNRCYTYFEHVPGLPTFTHLLALWEQSWRKHGWETRVLTRDDAYHHPYFHTFYNRIVVYPTINPRGYDEACWLRWLAFDSVGGGVMTDFDVMNMGLSPEHLAILDGDPVILEKNRVPCAVRASAAGVADIILRLQTPPQQKLGRHYSDMLFFQGETPYVAADVCREIMHEGWRDAPLIHFSRHGCRQFMPQTNKHDVVSAVVNSVCAPSAS